MNTFLCRNVRMRRSFKKSNSRKRRRSSQRRTSNCGPTRKGNSMTCFSTAELVAMARAWNDLVVPERRIDTGQPKDVLWKSLRAAFAPVCKSDESCWIEDGRLMEQLKKRYPKLHRAILFSIFKPKGTVKKYDWLSTREIDFVMKQYEEFFASLRFKFLGCWPSDYYHDVPFPWADIDRWDRCAIVFNLDSRNGPGSHWVAVYIHKDQTDGSIPVSSECQRILSRNGIKGGSPRALMTTLDRWQRQAPRTEADVVAISRCVEGALVGGGKHSSADVLTIEYFDSTGSPPNKRIAKTLKMIMAERPCSVMKVNDFEHQKGDTECGVYSMYFILQRLQNVSFEELRATRITDKSMNDYREELFRPRTNVFQKDFDKLKE